MLCKLGSFVTYRRENDFAGLIFAELLLNVFSNELFDECSGDFFALNRDCEKVSRPESEDEFIQGAVIDYDL